MSLFFAYPTPMLKAVSDATTKFVNEVQAVSPCAFGTELDVMFLDVGLRTMRFQWKIPPISSALWQRCAGS
jgi:hypothetical protein